MFVEGDDELVRLLPPFDAIDEADIDGLRTAVLDLVLKPDNSPALLDVDASTKEDNSRASDFVRVASWALAQDPYRMASWNEGVALTIAKQQGLNLFMGTGRWPSFQEWAYFVGLGVSTRHGLVMSPARAIREALSGEHPRVSVPADRDALLTKFLEDIASAIPIVDGGTYRARIDQVLRSSGHGFEARQVSPCLALALVQLEHEEEILLSDRPGDVAERLSFVGRAGHVFKTASHIRRGSPRRAGGVAVPPEEARP